jgi:hypothetical protein
MNTHDVEKRGKAVAYQLRQFETTATPDAAFVDGTTGAKAHGGNDGRDQPIRISDADRQEVATALGQNAAEGRLTMQELDERLGRVYGAKTYAELRPLLVDLPPGASAGDADGRSPDGRRARRAGTRRRPRSGYAVLNALCWAMWGISVATSSRHNLEGLWPLWLTLLWGLALLRRRPTCSGRTHGREGGHR